MGKDLSLKKLETDACELMLSETMCLVRKRSRTIKYGELAFLVIYNIESANNSESYNQQEKEHLIRDYLKAYHIVWDLMIQSRNEERSKSNGSESKPTTSDSRSDDSNTLQETFKSCR